MCVNHDTIHNVAYDEMLDPQSEMYQLICRAFNFLAHILRMSRDSWMGERDK